MNCAAGAGTAAPGVAGTDGAGGNGAPGGKLWRGGNGVVRCGGNGVEVQAARTSATRLRERGRLQRINDMENRMWVLFLEASAAFFALVLIVWWTMFSGRPEQAASPLPTAADKDEGTSGPR
jgi:hypothetical protein